MQLLNNKKIIIILVLISVTITIVQVQAQDYDEYEYARRNRRRRPQYQHSGTSGPCGRFFSYINLNYNVDCGHGGAGGGSIDDFLGGHGGHGGQGYRPQKPHRPNGGLGGGGLYGDNQVGFFNRPIWGPIGNLASNIGNTVGSFANEIGGNIGGGGGGGDFFDGSIINSFASLFTNNNPNPGSGSGSSSPIINNRPHPAPVSEVIEAVTNRPPGQTTDGLPNVEPHPVVPIVDLRPVHEEYYDEVTEATLYGNSRPTITNKLINNRYFSATYGGGDGGHHHNHNGGLFDINYNKAFKKINRHINQAFNYLFKR